VIRQCLLEFVSPLALNYCQYLLAAIASVWNDRRQRSSATKRVCAVCFVSLISNTNFSYLHKIHNAICLLIDSYALFGSFLVLFISIANLIFLFLLLVVSDFHLLHVFN
jgi:hypothetical protein